MTVYELIQKLVGFPANANMKFKATISSDTVTCNQCDEETDVDERNVDLDFDDILDTNHNTITFYLES